MESTSYLDYLPVGELSLDYQDVNSLPWPCLTPRGAYVNMQVSGLLPFRLTQQMGMRISKRHLVILFQPQLTGTGSVLWSRSIVF